MSVASENAGPIALLEASAEARALIEELTRLAEDLKARQERLGELLAPSEAALRARTEYLDNVMQDELARAGERVLKLAEEAVITGRRVSQDVLQLTGRLGEAEARRQSQRARHERWLMIIALVTTLLGGFLAGTVANWRSGALVSARPPAIEPVSPKGAPASPHRNAGQSTRPATKTVR